MDLPIHMHNSLTRRRERFVPVIQDQVRMYVCGPTVYDRAHLGNARSAVVFDQWHRLLKLVYPQVIFVRNITDIDDKINEASRQRGISIETITQETTQWYHDDMASLGVLPPTIEPKATHHISEMIEMIQHLIAKQHAYTAEGHVLFRARSFSTYGTLSGRSLDEILAGARVEVAPYKEDPADFVLWKPSDEITPGWTSPWGRGRPGWHIECSAMCEKHLGFPLDIHAGGQDLMFPHHENEIAQGECVTGKTYAHYWLHNGMLTVDGQKMSKSLGNFLTVADLMAQHSGEVIRYALLSSHYRQNLDWTEGLLHQAHQSLNRFYSVLRKAKEVGEIPQPVDLPEVAALLSDDLNTPQAFAYLHTQATSLNKTWSTDVFNQFYASCQLLGFLEIDAETWFRGADLTGEEEAWIQEQLHLRLKAKEERDFAKADEIRQMLTEKGIVLEDRKDGTTTWKKEISHGGK